MPASSIVDCVVIHNLYARWYASVTSDEGFGDTGVVGVVVSSHSILGRSGMISLNLVGIVVDQDVDWDGDEGTSIPPHPPANPHFDISGGFTSGDKGLSSITSATTFTILLTDQVFHAVFL